MDKTQVFQSGEKSVYIEENTGQITIYTPNGVQIINPRQADYLDILRKEFGNHFEKILDILNELLNKSHLPHILTPEPFKVKDFFGREKELEEIHDRLFSPDGNLLMLVNGDGGVGKTALASAYFFRYKEEYTHVAWLLSQQSIANAMLELELPLGLPMDEKLDINARITRLLTAMANLKKPCLLILDNANETDDLQANYIRLGQCTRFHLLLTTRVTEFADAAFYKIKGLPFDNALTMFEKHYRKLSQEELELFGQVRNAVGENTLVLELFAKNLRNVNKLHNYTLSDLWSDLQSKGLFGIAKSSAVDTVYHPVDGQLRHEKPEAIIATMYDLSGLTAGETALLSVFAVLPAESISFTLLETLLPSKTELDKHLLSLSQKGWVEFNETAKTFKCSPVIQEVTRSKNPNLRTDCKTLINTLNDKLEYEAYHTTGSAYTEAQLYARYAEAIVLALKEKALDVRLYMLCERIGRYFDVIGNLHKTLEVFVLGNEIFITLCTNEPDNPDFKNGLAISYEKLGITHSALGNLEKALKYFEDETVLFEEIYKAFPQNVSFKNGLAISYQYLGNTHSSLGNLEKALGFYENLTHLEKELYEAYPQNVSFKNGLAISYSKLGNTHSALGNLEKALKYFEIGSELGKELYEAFPQNVSFKNGLAISYSKLGETHSALGNLEKALEYYEKDLELTKELYEAFPQNVDFKNGLAISYQNLGNTHSSLGNLEKALKYYEQYLELKKELYEAFPQNVSFKNGLAVSYSKLGNTHSALGNLEKALKYYEKDLELTKELYEAFPQNVSFIYGLSVSFQNLGNTHSSLGNLDNALNFREKDAQLSKELYEAFPQNVSFKNGLAVSYWKLGDLFRTKNDKTKARQYFKQTEKLQEELVRDAPGYVEFQKNLAEVRQDLAGL